MRQPTLDMLATSLQERGETMITAHPRAGEPLTLAGITELVDAVGIDPRQVQISGWLGSIHLKVTP